MVSVWKTWESFQETTSLENADSEDLSSKFKLPEYLVFGSILVISAGIGLFYGCIGSKQKSNEEFLMGGRQMAPLPVALSLICSFVSAITLLGNPAEMYMYGTQYSMTLLSFIPLTLTLTYLYVPVFFKLQLTSAYEYFELRFNRRVRLVVSFCSIIYLLCYMSIVVYGPSIALAQVTGINHRISVAAIFIVCIFYSSLGGIKSVVATDSLQCIIMLASVAAVVGKGISDLGGFHEVWTIAKENGRIEFFNFDPDPRVRYTIFGSVIGEYFTWVGIYAATQSNIQRFVSISTISKVRRALLYNLIGLFILMALCLLSGLVIFAKYANCDPLSTGKVETSDQLLPLFVMETLGAYPGLPGFFVAGITCASLSSVSSGLNALAAIITEDYLKHSKHKISDETMSNYSKLICVVSGILSFGFTFAAELVDNIFPTATTLLGVMLGPTLGIFSLGLFFPWANSHGSLIGYICSLSFMIFMGLGSVIYSDRIPNQKLPISTSGCIFNTTLTTSTTTWASTTVEPEDHGFLINLFSVSFMWNFTIGCILALSLGLMFSLFFKNQKNSVKSSCISPPFLKLWKILFPKQISELIIEDNEKGLNNIKCNQF